MRFFIVFLLFFTGFASLWLLLVWGQSGHPTRMSQWIEDVYVKKESIAQKIEGRKIVIVAGSNALFGIDSAMLSKAFGMPVVNAAVNAGIELPCTLFMAQRFIGEGDTVVVPLEYPMYSYEGKPGVQMIDFLFSREPGCFWQLTWEEQFYMLWHVSLQRVWEGYRGYENTPVTSGLYGAQHIDAYGDQTETTLSHRTDAMYKEVLGYVEHPETYGSTFDPHALGWEYLQAFVDRCEARHAKVLFMPSTLMYDERYKKDPKEKWFYEHIAQEVRKRGWMYVGNPYDYMYAPSLYFNTNFHLIDSARKMRTKQMIEDLRSTL